RAVCRRGRAGHGVYPALSPRGAGPPVHAGLAGVSLTVTLEAPLRKGRLTTTGGFLSTHRGYSGPSVLNISHLAVRSRLAGGPRQPILVRWTEFDAAAWDGILREARGTVGA